MSRLLLQSKSLEPIHVSNVGVHPAVRNELECVANNTLANTIRQLSSLSKHAEDMFTELFTEASSVYNRLNQLQSRMEDVHRKVKQLDATVEEVSLQDIHLRKPYQSNFVPDQQVVSSSTMPNAMRITYSQCDRAPALEKLDIFREDGKDSMKFYTDSHFFVDFWYAEMQKEIEQKKTDIKARKKRRPKIQGDRPIRPVKTKKDEYQKMALGVEFSDYQTPNIHGPVHGKVHQRKGQPHPQQQQQHQQQQQQQQQQRPDSLEIVSTPTGSTGIPEMSYDMTNPDVIPNGYPSQINGPYSMMNHTPAENMTPEHAAGLPNRNNAQYMQGNQMSPSHAVGSHGRSIARALNQNSARPSRPPPDPPSLPGTPKHEPMRNSPVVRESLPPPPLPPDQIEDVSDSYTGSPDVTPKHVAQKVHDYDGSSGSPIRSSDSPSRQQAYGNQNRTPDSAEFPLPPSPPKVPILLVPHSLTTTSLGSAGKVEEIPKPAPGQDRSALLEEIRLGEWYKKLRRVEDRKKQEQQKRQPAGGRFDVQAIMDRAIEVRRKALEASDSEEEAFSDENEWDSE
ncbi:Wiskott-Aldrich syndrome protein family member 3 [Acanthosepion pharaonis]|uniref:Wiskott-Aldrich syndrome protein family member n=1 Tax=Acanthosepion pharaonis TaxID=158019 RepID=A0A812BVK8_ACAPH|nr:Wiskott-Aldrich syndrome protein family member 3 [Sepia pharaonis]